MSSANIKPKITAAVSRGFLATALLSCIKWLYCVEKRLTAANCLYISGFCTGLRPRLPGFRLWSPLGDFRPHTLFAPSDATPEPGYAMCGRKICGYIAISDALLLVASVNLANSVLAITAFQRTLSRHAQLPASILLLMRRWNDSCRNVLKSIRDRPNTIFPFAIT